MTVGNLLKIEAYVPEHEDYEKSDEVYWNGDDTVWPKEAKSRREGVGENGRAVRAFWVFVGH